MRRNREQCLFGWAMVLSVLLSFTPALSQAAEWVHEGMAEAGKFTAGFRVGPSFTTQSAGVSTAGPAMNFQGMFGLNKWFRLGMMLEWENHGLDSPRSGSVNTVTLLPVNLEYRPGHFGALIPYVTSGIGVNINTKDQADSFAWRFGAGLDYPMTSLFQGAPKGLMLNMETAWKRNSADGDRSTMGLLFGVRHTF